MTSAASSPELAPVIAGTGVGVPGHAYAQAELLELMDALLVGVDASALARWVAATGVERRHLALPLDAYAKLRGLGDSNDAWIEVAEQLGEQVARAALFDAGIEPGEVGLLATTTVTGLAVPTLDVRLMNAIAFAPTLKRVPMFGLGCVGGAAGIARVADYLRAFPEQAAMLVSVELCSLTVQREDSSIAGQIAASLFSDGAAAVVLVGAHHPLAVRARPTVLDSRSTLFPATQRVMGFDIVDTGFRVVLSPGVPKLVARELARLVDDFLASHALTRADVATWIAHPGGPKVIAAVQTALGLADADVEVARESLANFGNMSSASVLFGLDEVRRRRRPQPGSYGLLFALGPAFCAELVLLRW